MSTASTTLEPPDRGLVARVLAPMIDPRAYLRAVHLLVMFPLGLAYFVFFVVTLAFGGALIWTIVGPPVLLLTMFVSLWIGDAEAALVNIVTRSDIRRPPQALEGVTSFREKVWSRIIDPSTWMGLLYALVQFPVGIAGFVLVVTVFSVAGYLIASPLIVGLTDEVIEIGGDSSLVIDSAFEALPFAVLGVLTWVVGMHVIVACSTLHAKWARLMLGSRGRRRVDDTTTEPPGPSGPPPRQLMPPDDSSTLPAGPQPGNERGAGAGLAGLAGQEHPAVRLLTTREREVTKLIARGYSNADICETCYISEGTVKTHVRNILAKLDLRDRTQVVVFAYESGLVHPGGWRAAATNVSELIV